MHALVTGAAGFVGRRLCSHLASQGWHVVGCDVASEQSVSILPCDIADSAQVDALFEKAAGITHVFHLAALTFVPDANRDPHLAFAVNLGGTQNVVRALRRHTPQARLVFIGTADMYGRPQCLPITEDHPLNPLNPYSQSKMESEAFCLEAHRAQGLDFIGLRPFNHSGPGQADKFVLSSFAHQIARIEAGLQAPVLRVGNLAAARDFSHVDDVVRAYELAAVKGKSGEIYNVCSGVSIPIRQALDLMRTKSIRQIEVQTDPERVRGAETTEVRGSNDKLVAATGWTPLRKFDDILSDLLAYWRERP